LVACLQTNRVGIGIEINQDYCQLAAKRLSQQEAVPIHDSDHVARPSLMEGRTAWENSDTFRFSHPNCSAWLSEAAGYIE
jgi:hypothetical protein